MKKIILLVFLLIPIKVVAWDIELIGWDLVDKGGHLDYQSYSKYNLYIKKATNIWNKETKIIRRDSIKTVADVIFVDKNFISNGVVGLTSNYGVVTFAKKYMDNLSKKQQLSVCIHEIGHALGLDHRDEVFSVMFPYVAGDANVSLTDEDKINFKYAIKNYKKNK